MTFNKKKKEIEIRFFNSRRDRRKLMELRRRQSMLQRRLGLMGKHRHAQGQGGPFTMMRGEGSQQIQQIITNPVAEAKRMLRRLDGVVEVAKSEVAMIRDVARNITESGKELNLWEMMSAVNATLRDRPDSPLGRLMGRFYSRWVAKHCPFLHT